MPAHSLAVSVRFDAVPGDDVVDMLRTRLRPGDDGLMVWRDADPTVLRLATDCPAVDLEEALARGLQFADDAVAVGGRRGAVLEVVAMDDEQQLVWRAEP